MDRLWAKVTVAAIAALFGFVSLWIIYEQDIFWQIRAGAELLQTHAWPHVDTWSYSARGQPWLNIQWLATVLLYLGYAAGEVPGLVVMRGALVALLFTLMGVGVVLATRAVRQAITCWIVFVTLPIIYVALLPRLQLRSDFLVLIAFAALVTLWQAQWPAPRKRMGTVLLMLLAANLHTGTAPFVGVAALAFLWADTGLSWRAACLWSGACALAFFATPYTYHVLPTLYEHFFYYDYNLLPNTDQVSLDQDYFAAGWAGQAWLVLCAIAAAGAVFAWWQQGGTWSVLATPPTAAMALACALLTYMCFNRVRSIPYHVVFILPFAARALQQVRMPATFRACAMACAIVAWALTAQSMAPMRGYGVHEGLYPVGSAAFVERVRPQPNVFHTFACGAYLVWYMRDYPLYVDTRETMYWSLQKEVIGSFYSPEVTQALVDKYHVNTMLFPIPPTRFKEDRTFEDVIARYLPNDEWAVVYFDKASFVALKRIPEHDALIAKYEYTMLKPNLPANLYPMSNTRTPEWDAVFAQEVARCRHDEPDDVWCLTAESAFLSLTDEAAYARVAVPNMEKALRVAERWNSPQMMTVLVELQRAYKRTGDTQKARAIARRLGLHDDD